MARIFPGVLKQEMAKKRKERVFKEVHERTKNERAQRFAKAAADVEEKKKLEQARKERRDAVKKTINFDTKKDIKLDKVLDVSSKTFGVSLLLGIFSFVAAVGTGFKEVWVPDNENMEPMDWTGYGAPSGVSGYKDVVETDSKFSDVMFYISLGAFCSLILSICTIIGLIAQDKIGNKAKDKAIDLMLDIADKKSELKINEKQLKKLLKVVPEVVSRMSAAERVYFEMLMNGDLQIVDNKTFRGMAIAIMEGHLQSHPEDIKRILDVFDRDSIPQEILNKAKSNGR